MPKDNLVPARQNKTEERRGVGVSLSENKNFIMIDTWTDILRERKRQNDKWGLQRHDYGKWLAILTEEVGEVAQAMQKEWGWGKPTDQDDLYTELIHVAAVACAIAEQVMEERERNGKGN